MTQENGQLKGKLGALMERTLGGDDGRSDPNPVGTREMKNRQAASRDD